jgi:hypothetical protein
MVRNWVNRQQFSEHLFRAMEVGSHAEEKSSAVN